MSESPEGPASEFGRAFNDALFSMRAENAQLLARVHRLESALGKLLPFLDEEVECYIHAFEPEYIAAIKEAHEAAKEKTVWPTIN